MDTPDWVLPDFSADLRAELEAGMAQHRAEVEAIAGGDVDAFEAAVLERHGLDVPALGWHEHSTFFTHIFDGPYPGTHYSYLSSALLEAITLQWLDEQGGLTRAAGRRLREEFLARGAAVDPFAALRSLTGREPSVGPLLERRGLAVPGVRT